MCTFFGPNFPDIIPVHTDVSKHPGCEEQHHNDIVDWGHYPHKAAKAKIPRIKGNNSSAKAKNAIQFIAITTDYDV